MALKKKKQKAKSTLNGVVLAVAIAEPLMTIPQIYSIWSTHSAAGVSLITWAGYIAAATTWLVYGFATKDKPLIVSSALWVLAEGLVFIGALRY